MRIDLIKIKTAAETARASMERNKVPGLAMAFLHDGKLAWVETLGLSDPARGLPVTEQTHFEAASLTKPAFSYVVRAGEKQGSGLRDEEYEWVSLAPDGIE